MSAEDLKHPPSKEKTFTRRSLLRNLFTTGTGAAFGYSFYKSGEIFRKISSIDEAIESNEYWSQRTPAAKPEETERLRDIKNDLGEQQEPLFLTTLISGAVLLADIKLRSRTSTPNEKGHAPKLKMQS